MAFSSYGVGQYQASEAHQFWAPRMYKPDGTKRCVIFCHGAGGSYAVGPHEKLFAAKGIPIMSTDLGGADTWGNDTSLSRITTAWTYAKSTFGAKTDRYGLWAGSMGTLTALLQILADSAHICVMGGALPIVDPEQVRAANAGGYQAAIQTALTGGVDTTVADAKRPNQNNSSFVSAGVPVKLWISSSDTVGDSTLANSFVSAIGAQSASLGAVGHSYLTMDNDSAATWLASHL